MHKMNYAPGTIDANRITDFCFLLFVGMTQFDFVEFRFLNFAYFYIVSKLLCIYAFRMRQFVLFDLINILFLNGFLL